MLKEALTDCNTYRHGQSVQRLQILDFFLILVTAFDIDSVIFVGMLEDYIINERL